MGVGVGTLLYNEQAAIVRKFYTAEAAVPPTTPASTWR
jgi:hypothetical protein